MQGGKPQFCLILLSGGLHWAGFLRNAPKNTDFGPFLRHCNANLLTNPT